MHGARARAHACATSRAIVRNYVRPVITMHDVARDAPADKGPKFVDHGGRYSIFLRIRRLDRIRSDP